MIDERVTRELQEQGRKADREDRKRAELFEIMVKTEAWQTYARLVYSHVQAISDRMLVPEEQLRSGPLSTNSEFLKGTMRGLLEAIQLPDATITGVKQAAPKGDDDDE